jgi:protein-tyrosine phosphatase
MDWITDGIAIGNYLDAQDRDLLRRESIASILGLTSALLNTTAAEMGVRAIEIVPLIDLPGNDARLFRRAVDTLARLHHEAKPVLIHCHAGRSRSVVVVAGYLMRSLGISADEALARIAAKRDIAVTTGLEQLLDTLD